MSDLINLNDVFRVNIYQKKMCAITTQNEIGLHLGSACKAKKDSRLKINSAAVWVFSFSHHRQRTDRMRLPIEGIMQCKSARWTANKLASISSKSSDRCQKSFSVCRKNLSSPFC